jgi:hypothetical protein
MILVDCPSGLDDGTGRHLALFENGDIQLCRPCGGTGKIIVRQDQVNDLSGMVDAIRGMAQRADQIRADAKKQEAEQGGAGES